MTDTSIYINDPEDKSEHSFYSTFWHLCELGQDFRLSSLQPLRWHLSSIDNGQLSTRDTFITKPQPTLRFHCDVQMSKLSSRRKGSF